MSLVIAADPGKITGYAFWNGGLDLLESGQMPLFDFLQMADGRITLVSRPTIVCERFTVTQRTVTKAGDAHWAMQGIGVLQYFAFARGCDFVLQSPAEAKSFATDDKLKAIGWYKHTTGGHRNDATRHLLTYLVRNKLVPASALL